MRVIRFTPDSVYHLAERAGLKSGKRPNLTNLTNLTSGVFLTHARTLYTENENQLEEEQPEELEQMLNAKQENGVHAGNRVWKNSKIHRQATRFSYNNVRVWA